MCLSSSPHFLTRLGGVQIFFEDRNFEDEEQCVVSEGRSETRTRSRSSTITTLGTDARRKRSGGGMAATTTPAITATPLSTPSPLRSNPSTSTPQTTQPTIGQRNTNRSRWLLLRNIIFEIIHFLLLLAQVTDHNTAVLRRASNFYLAIHARDRAIDLAKDQVKVIFEFGESSSVLHLDRTTMLPKTNATYFCLFRFKGITEMLVRILKPSFLCAREF